MFSLLIVCFGVKYEFKKIVLTVRFWSNALKLKKLAESVTIFMRTGTVCPKAVGQSFVVLDLPLSKSRPPDKSIATVTNQKAASTDPVKCATIPKPNAPIP